MAGIDTDIGDVSKQNITRITAYRFGMVAFLQPLCRGDMCIPLSDKFLL